MLFENRMGCLNKTVPEETQKFITSVGEMFSLSQIVTLFPKSAWPYLPFWKKFVAAWDHLFKVGEENAAPRFYCYGFTGVHFCATAHLMIVVAEGHSSSDFMALFSSCIIV